MANFKFGRKVYVDERTKESADTLIAQAECALGRLLDLGFTVKVDKLPLRPDILTCWGLAQAYRSDGKTVNLYEPLNVKGIENLRALIASAS